MGKRDREKVFIVFHALRLTLPETNIAPENRPLEKEIPIGNHHILGWAILVLGRVPPSEKGFYAWPYVPLNYAETHCEREYRCLTANHLQDTCVNFGGVVCCINI